MQTKGLLLVIAIFGTIFLFRPVVVSAYDNLTTHPALTQEILNFYGSTTFTTEEREWIIQGSVEEDTPPRWLNHFYDPLSGQGWTGENTGELPSSFVLEFSDLFLAPTDPVSAVRWVNDGLTQLEYGRYGGDETWKRGLKYFADGDKKDAYIALGHALHLLEDMAVPEHARNDTHIDTFGIVTGEYGSPYEEYTMKWTRTSIGEAQIANRLRAENAAPLAKSSIEDYLISVAQYSNKYFFSKDTINSPKYSLPKIVRDDGNFGYGVDENGVEFPLVKVDINLGTNREVIKTYSIKNTIENRPVLDAYFTHLARQAVLNGAGVVALFEKQAEDAVVNKDFQFQTANEDVVKFFVSGFSFYGEWVKVTNTVGGFIGNAISALGGFVGNGFDKLTAGGGALIADAFGTLIGPNEINIVGADSGSGGTPADAEALAGKSATVASAMPTQSSSLDLASASQTVPAQHSNILQNVGMLSPTIVGGIPAQLSLREELAAALGRLTELLRQQLATSGTRTQALAALAAYGGGGSTLLTTGGGNSPQSPAASPSNPQAGGATEILVSVNSEQTTSTQPSQGATADTAENSTTTESDNTASTTEDAGSVSSSEPIQEATDTVLFSQPVDSALSQESHYSDNWYQLGGGYAGTLHKLTLRGMVDSRDYFASHVSLHEFYDSAYTTLVHTYTISDNAPFTNEMATTTFENLSIRLKPYFYYRLDTTQDYQNVSVVLAGTDATSSPQTGTAMWNDFSYGRGRVEYKYAFTPFMVGGGVAATSTSRPPLTAPGNPTFNLDTFNHRLNFSWSSSTDPDWPENNLHYEINYSSSTDSTSSPQAGSGQATPTAFADNGWISAGYNSLAQPNLAYGIDVVFGNVYTIGVRARDNFGAVSSSTTAVWSFPSDYVPPIEQLDHSNGIGWSSQKIFIPRDMTIDAIYMWGAPQSGWYCCSQTFVNVYGDESGTPTAAPIATSNSATLGRLWGDQELEYSFNEPVTLTGNVFYWLTPVGGPSPTTNGTSFFGSAGDIYPGGFWADGAGADTGHDAYFRLRSL